MQLLLGAGSTLLVLTLVGCKSFQETSERLDRERAVKAEQSQRERDLRIDSEHAARVCRAQSIPGGVSGVTAAIESRRKELEEVKVVLTAEQYRKSAQVLADYSAEWEMMNQSYAVACQVYMICDARFREREACERDRQEYNASVQRANEFLIKIKTLNVRADSVRTP
jgi:hypothetical protein